MYLLETAALEFRNPFLEGDIVAVIGHVMNAFAVRLEEVREDRRAETGSISSQTILPDCAKQTVSSNETASPL
ncbi:hypothetical protein [Rhizobium sp. WSM1325]|uniref:hypothetical protein n=1 Tax=Rhizobium sp. WSM1325 TaxID=3444086 RepID=UPI001FDF5C23|nr:hypothetical protein [Rhizobium leguminosarum]